jgi:hypothetical protein
LNQFYNVENEKCTDCTECPSDTIVLTTCGWFSDIKCQPLAGLKFDYIVPQNSAKWTSKGDKKSTLSRTIHMAIVYFCNKHMQKAYALQQYWLVTSWLILIELQT